MADGPGTLIYHTPMHSSREFQRWDPIRILEARRHLFRDGVPVETYRRIGLDGALGLLGSPTPALAG